jgi:hypothetical protein
MRRLLHSDRWWANPLVWLEWFLVANLAFLAVDIAIAHAVNVFEHWAEWIPIGFSAASTLVFLAAMALGGPRPKPESAARSPRARLVRWLGLIVGGGSIVVGIAGLLWHLNGAFFQEQTLKNLVYTAPFAAPLAYTGLGLLLLLNRMVEPTSREWYQWVLLLAAGGFAGNFVLSLADHAQNGFFEPSEWVGVVAAAVAFGFLVAGAIVPEGRGLLIMNVAIMVVQVGVGLLGFFLHVRGNLNQPGGSLWDRFVYGAPVFAPLLFADLAILAMLGLWAQARALAAADSAAVQLASQPVRTL